MSLSWERIAAALSDLDDRSGGPGGSGGAGRTGEAGRSGPGGSGGAGGGSGSSLAEELARLFEALPLDLSARPDGHAGAQCRGCPVCRLITAARQLRPEAVEHLSAAAVELAAAIRVGLGQPDPGRRGSDRDTAAAAAPPDDPDPAGGRDRTGGRDPGGPDQGGPEPGGPDQGGPEPGRGPVQHIEVTD